jgi:hypothetical protein
VLDLLEAHAVVARILVPVHEADGGVVDALLQQLDDVELAVVLGRLADVVDRAADHVFRRVEHGDDPTGDVANVDVRPPELLAEDDEVPAGEDVARELVDRQVEAHPR